MVGFVVFGELYCTFKRVVFQVYRLFLRLLFLIGYEIYFGAIEIRIRSGLTYREISKGIWVIWKWSIRIDLVRFWQSYFDQGSFLNLKLHFMNSINNPLYTKECPILTFHTLFYIIYLPQYTILLSISIIILNINPKMLFFNPFSTIQIT